MLSFVPWWFFVTAAIDCITASVATSLKKLVPRTWPLLNIQKYLQAHYIIHRTQHYICCTASVIGPFVEPCICVLTE
jgi:hypothetical protein